MTFFAETHISGCAVNHMKKLDNYAFLLKIFACRAYISETKPDSKILKALFLIKLLKLSTGAHFQPEIRNFLLMNLNSLFGKTPITSFEMQLFNRDFWGFFIK